MRFDGSPRVGRSIAAGLAGVALAAAMVLGATGGVSGCSSNKSSSGSPDAQTVCPTAAADAIGASCNREGLSCYPEYACGITQAILTCTCAGGSFQCTDVTGKQLAAGDMPACPAAQDGGACPASESVANLSPCGQNQQGQECAYPAECDGGVPGYDTCYCFTGQTKSGTMGLRWECSNHCGAAGVPPTPDAGRPDAAMPPPDAGPDSGTEKDGGTD